MGMPLVMAAGEALLAQGGEDVRKIAGQLGRAMVQEALRFGLKASLAEVRK